MCPPQDRDKAREANTTRALREETRPDQIGAPESPAPDREAVERSIESWMAVVGR
jgi:hypothetical protein